MPIYPHIAAAAANGFTAEKLESLLFLSPDGINVELPELPMINIGRTVVHFGFMNMMIMNIMTVVHFGFITRSSGGRGRNGGGGGGVHPALIEFLIRRLWRDYDLDAQPPLEIFLANSNLEAGGQAHRVAHLLPAAAAAPAQEPSDIAKMLKGVMVQAFAAFLPACVTAYPQLKDAPDHVKFTIFGALAFITVGLFVGILSRSVVRRGLAFRLVSFSVITVLTFSVAFLFSSPTYIAFTALVGVSLNLIVMLLRIRF